MHKLKRPFKSSILQNYYGVFRPKKIPQINPSIWFCQEIQPPKVTLTPCNAHYEVYLRKFTFLLLGNNHLRNITFITWVAFNII